MKKSHWTNEQFVKKRTKFWQVMTDFELDILVGSLCSNIKPGSNTKMCISLNSYLCHNQRWLLTSKFVSMEYKSAHCCLLLWLDLGRPGSFRNRYQNFNFKTENNKWWGHACMKQCIKCPMISPSLSISCMFSYCYDLTNAVLWWNIIENRWVLENCSSYGKCWVHSKLKIIGC